MTKTSSQLYFVNRWVDFACMGGLSLIALASFAYLSGSQLIPFMALMSVYLSWVINWPHFSATNYRLFRRSSNLREFPVTAFWVPILVGTMVLVSFARPETVAPYFIKLFLIWSPYHFSGQNVGLSFLYARRAGFEWKVWEKRALSFFIFSTFLAPTISSEVQSRQMEYYQIFYPSLNAPVWMSLGAWWLMYVSAGMLALSAVWRLARRERFFPAIVLLPAITQFTWFVVGWRVPSFYYFVPMFHSLQYLLVAWAMEVAERKAEVKGAKTGFLNTTPGWLLVNIAGGAVLFAGLPKIAEYCGIPLMFATGVLIAGVQIHHFIVDGVIWKLRNPRVSAALAGQPLATMPRRKAA